MYRIVYEQVSTSPRYFEPRTPGLGRASTLREAYANIRAMLGKTRSADLVNERNPEVVERRRNRHAIATIRDCGC